MIKKPKKIKIEELELFIRTIKEDYNPKTNKQLFDLLLEHFNVVCTKKDLEHYDLLQDELEEHFNMFYEDFELESRKQQFFNASW